LTNIQTGDVQPNAVDLRLGSVYSINDSIFIIDEDHKQHRGSTLIPVGDDGYYHLSEGHYEVVMENKVTIGENEAGFVITRSTLNRNGVYLTSGLYDSGYSGVMAGVMHVTIGDMMIKPGTRIGQYIMWEAEMIGDGYDGDYGDGGQDDKTYHVVQ